MYCKNCIYWERNTDKDDNQNYGRCNNDKFNEFEPNKNETDNLVCFDGEGWSARVETGEAFGCVHFKSK